MLSAFLCHKTVQFVNVSIELTVMIKLQFNAVTPFMVNICTAFNASVETCMKSVFSF